MKIVLRIIVNAQRTIKNVARIIINALCILDLLL